jgi:hypothetical protein
MINEPSKGQLEATCMAMAESSRKSHEDNALKPFLNQQQIKQLDQWIKKQNDPSLNRIQAVRRLIEIGLR